MLAPAARGVYACDYTNLYGEKLAGGQKGCIGLEAALVEQEIVARITAAGIRLRFDRVALRLVSGVKSALRNFLPDGQAVIFTVTAPIRHPAKTGATLESLVRNELSRREFGGDVHGNRVQIRQVRVKAGTPKVFGFVHNSESDAAAILALTVSRLRSPDATQPKGKL